MLKKIINIIRWGLGFIISVAFLITFIIAIPLSVITYKISHENQVIKWLNNSNIYQDFPNILIQIVNIQNKSIIRDENGKYLTTLIQELNDSSSQLNKLVNKVLEPNIIKNKAEKVINSVYYWLREDTDYLEFEITLTDDKATLMDILILGFEKRTQNLPKCDPNFIITNEFNPLEMECVPQNYDISNIAEYIRQNSDRNEFNEIIKKSTFSGSMINIENDTEIKLKQVYKYIYNFALYTAILVCVLSLLILVIYPKIKNSLKILGFIYIINGLINSITFIIFQIYMKTLIKYLSEKTESIEIFVLFNNLIYEILGDLNISIIFVSVGLIIIGIIFIALSKYIKNTKSNT